jgi:chromosome segregation ATPase
MTDMSFTQAADEVRKLLRGLKAIDVVAEALEKVGSIDNARRESEARLPIVRGELEAANTALDAARAESVKIISNANAEAEAFVAKAQERVRALKAESAAEISEAEASAKARAETAEANLAGLREARDTLATEIKTLTAERDTIAKGLAAIRASIGG